MSESRAPQYVAELWWCGDEVCDCYQPRITLRTPNISAPPWWRLTDVWEGTFHSGPGGEEYTQMRAELEAECERRGIPLGVSDATDVSWSRVVAIDDEQMRKAGLR